MDKFQTAYSVRKSSKNNFYNMKQIYPNLNALRFIAASLVIIFHIELWKKFYDLPNLMYLDFFKIIGKLGVVLFFVLSGFLITSLLLREKDSTGNINFKTFYQRRVLRIWPLYFLILAIGFFVLPHFSYWNIHNEMFPPLKEHFWIKLLLYVIILPNLAVVLFREIAGVSQAWSLGTEEQFYLIWPFIIKYFRNNLLPAMIGLLIFYWIVKLGAGKLGATSETWRHILDFWSLFNINCMAIGGIAAVIYHDNHQKILNVLFNKNFFLFICTYTIVCLLLGIKFGFFHYEVYSFLFGIIILNLACNSVHEKRLENKKINYLGSISYGLYMYHSMVVPVAVIMGKKYDSSLLVYCITFGCTILLAAISFEYFEKYFLKLKSRLH